MNSIVGITLLGILVCFAAIGGGGIFDVESMVFIVLLTAAMMLSVGLANRLALPLIVVLIIYTFQRYVLSGYSMLFIGNLADSPAFSGYASFAVEEYNSSLRYALLGFIAVASGLLVGVGKVPQRIRVGGLQSLRDLSTQRLSGPILFAFTIAVVSFRLVSSILWGESAVGIRDESEGSWLRIFANFNIPLIIILSVLSFRGDYLRTRDRALLYASLGALFLGSIVGGSRSFIYGVLVNFLLVFWVLKRGNFPVRRVPRAAVLVMTIALVAYPVATAVRYRVLYESNQAFSASSVGEAWEALYGSMENPGRTMALSILGRLNSFETSMVIMNDRNVLPVERYLTLPKIAGRIVNNLVPGDLVSLTAPQYLFDRIYSDRFVGWNAIDWGLWEEFYLIFGYWPGLCVLLLCVLVVGSTWRRLILTDRPYKLFYIGTFAYTFWQRILVNYEVSLVLSSVLVQLIAFHVLVFVMWRLNSLLGLRPLESSGEAARVDVPPSVQPLPMLDLEPSAVPPKPDPPLG